MPLVSKEYSTNRRHDIEINFILQTAAQDEPIIPLRNGLADLLVEHGGMIPLNQPLIVGGDQTTIEQFPWIITLQSFGAHRCGGSIISTTRILSAAHCTVNIATIHSSWFNKQSSWWAIDWACSDHQSSTVQSKHN